MYRKNNPWVSLVALLLMVLILVLNCTGCVVGANGATADRFDIELDACYDGVRTYAITDTHTGGQYMYICGNNGGGVIALEG